MRINLKTWMVMLIFLLVVASMTSAGEIIYVDVNAPPDGDGASWETAFNYLQDGLADAAGAGDEIRVAEGTYTPDTNSMSPGGSGSRDATFSLKNGVAIRGGYAGYGEPDPNARDIKAYETTLSGDLAGDDGPNFANNGENSYHVVTGSDTDETAVLDGFTITASNTNNVPWPNNRGGGMYNVNGSPTVINCTFIGNSAGYGGGMFNSSGSPTITDCTFSGNSARHWGGGMDNRYGSSPTVTNCSFSGNIGTGMSNSGVDLTLINCTFSGNSKSGMSNFGADLTLINCTFSGNSDSGISCHEGTQTLINCTICGNSASNGGGMHVGHMCNSVLTNCILWDNIATNGPQIQTFGNLSVSYCNIQGGQIDISGVGLNWLDGNIGDDLVNDDPLFVDPGHWDMATWVDGDYHLQSQAGRWAPDLFRSSDFSGDNFVNLIDFAYFADLWHQDGNLPADLNNDGLVDMEDLWVFSEKYLTNGNRGGWVFDSVTSRCIDAGNPGCPLGDEPSSPNNSRINMGAYGGTAQASKTPANWASLADMTNNHIVDINDLTVFTYYWLDSGECIPSDLNRNGSVDLPDFGLFANEWLWEQ